MHVGAFFNVSNSTLDVICDRFDLLLHLRMELGLLLLLRSISLIPVVVCVILTATFSWPAALAA
jgi:hypothetical protein